MKKEQLLDNICFALIVISLIIILIFRNNYKVDLYAIAFIAIVYGIMNIKKKGSTSFIFISLGISLTISGTLYFTKIFDLVKAFTFMIGCSVFLLMAVTLIFTYLRKKIIDENYALKVNAIVVDLVSNDNTNAKFFQPYYKYSVDDHDYSVLHPGFINKNIPKIGDTVPIRVSKDDYQDVYFDKTPTEKLFDLILVVFLLIVSLVISIMQFF